jgi:hypothetical protein
MMESNDKYPESEANARFEAALKGAFSASPKPMKNIPRKRPKRKREPKSKAPA